MRQLKISKSITTREDPSLEKYLNEINKVTKLTPEEEVDLFIKFKSGDEKACEAIVSANLLFVVSVAKQSQGQGIPLTDLINEGNLGLIRAVETYDHSRGFKFISYAVWWIRQSINDFLAEYSRIVRLPHNKVSMVSRVMKAYNSLSQVYGRTPSNEEIAEFIKLDVDTVEGCMSLYNNKKHSSFDAPVGNTSHEDNSTTLLDSYESNDDSPDKDIVYQNLKEELGRFVSKLRSHKDTDRREKVIRYYYGIGVEKMSLEDIGIKLGLTKNRVEQIRQTALVQLRKMEKDSNLLKPYLGQ